MDAAYADAWNSARHDAGLDEDDIRLYPFDDEPKDDSPTAMFWDPSSYPDPTGKTGPPLTRAQREDASANADKYRIAIHTRLSVTAFGAKLRHELEHVRQHKRWTRRLFEVGHGIQVLQYRAFGGKRGTGYLFNLVPSERDANLAAATFARPYFGEAEADTLLETDEAVLLRPGPPPESVDTLGLRQLAFAAIYAPEFETAVENEIRATADAHFAPLGSEASDLWRDLRADQELRELAAAAVAAAPSQESVNAAERNVGRLWTKAVEATIAAEQRARTVAGIEQRVS